MWRPGDSWPLAGAVLHANSLYSDADPASGGVHRSVRFDSEGRSVKGEGACLIFRSLKYIQIGNWVKRPWSPILSH